MHGDFSCNSHILTSHYSIPSDEAQAIENVDSHILYRISDLQSHSAELSMVFIWEFSHGIVVWYFIDDSADLLIVRSKNPHVEFPSSPILGSSLLQHLFISYFFHDRGNQFCREFFYAIINSSHVNIGICAFIMEIHRIPTDKIRTKISLLTAYFGYGSKTSVGTQMAMSIYFIAS